MTDANGNEDQKRKKNREAAKRCRDKKQKEMEDLKQRNDELERENCGLIWQRDELLQKCHGYEKLIDHHKTHGCLVQQFNPTCNQLSDLSSPPSPSFSKSGTSSLSSSPVSCSSPCLEPNAELINKHNITHTDLSEQDNAEAGEHELSKEVLMISDKPVSNYVFGMPCTASSMAHVKPVQHSLEQHIKPEAYFIKVGERLLCFSYENFLKFMQRLSSHRQELEKQQVQSIFVPANCSAPEMPMQAEPDNNDAVQSQTQALEQLELIPGRVGVDTLVSELDEVTENFGLCKSQEQIVEQCYTAEHNLKISDKISENYVLVNPNDVLITEKLGDFQYDQHGEILLSTRCEVSKQKVVENTDMINNISVSGYWDHQTIGEVKATGSPNEASNSFVHKESLVLGSEIGNAFTVTVIDPNTAQIVEQATEKSISLYP